MNRIYQFRFSKPLKRRLKKITVLDMSLPSGERVIYKKSDKKKKKDRKGLKGPQKLVRKLAKASKVYSDTYLERHDRSRRKKRSGWLKDLSKNTTRARRKAMKKLK